MVSRKIIVKDKDAEKVKAFFSMIQDRKKELELKYRKLFKW